MRSQAMQHSTSKRAYDSWNLISEEGTAPDARLQQAQTTIYEIFFTLTKIWAPDDVLSLFRQIFLHGIDSSGSNLTPAVYTILTIGEEQNFHYTLNRVCYILINNWETARNEDAILKLIDLLSSVTHLKAGTALQLRTLRRWLSTFLSSQAFKDLKLYASRYTRPSHWTHRYTSYLLASQSLNQNNPDEQRSIANIASGEIKREFKRKLAMYAIHADKPRKVNHAPDNPTLLGEHILPLIKKILTSNGKLSYQSLANIFLAQSKNIKFKRFKRGFAEYLIFSMGSEAMTDVLKAQLFDHLSPLYHHYDDCPVDDAILLRTANQSIDFLTIDKCGTPAPIMTLLLGKGYALTLAILLLKVIIISPKSRTYLEGKIGDIVAYYSEVPETECQWLIQFLEILNVTFTIYSDPSVSYNLVSVSQPPTHPQQNSSTQPQKKTHPSPQGTTYQHKRPFQDSETSSQENQSPYVDDQASYRIFSAVSLGKHEDSTSHNSCPRIN